MTLAANNWALIAYTPGAWTDLVPTAAGPTVIKSLIVTVGGSAAAIKARITDASSALVATVFPDTVLSVNTAHTADIPLVCLKAGQKLQVNVSVAGVEISAHGAA